MCGSGNSTCNRNMRQRSEVMQCISFFVQPGSQFAILDTAFHGYCLTVLIELDYFVHIAKRDKTISAVGDIIEAMPRAQHFYFVVFFYGLLYGCLLYTSDAADERSSVDLGGRRIIKKK